MFGAIVKFGQRWRKIDCNTVGSKLVRAVTLIDHKAIDAVFDISGG